MHKPFVLFKLPSRGREKRFFDSLDSIVNNVSDTENYWISCTLDYDDPVMTNPKVIDRISQYKNISIEWGLSDSKIHAVNRNMPDNIKWDILVISSDDILFCIYGFDDMIRMEMEINFPEGDGYLHFYEKDSKQMLNVMTVIDWKYYSRFGYVYHHTYSSVWADNEQMDVANILGRYKYIDYEIFYHKNPAYNYPGFERDEMFDFQQNLWPLDETNYYERKAKNFDLK